MMIKFCVFLIVITGLATTATESVVQATLSPDRLKSDYKDDSPVFSQILKTNKDVTDKNLFEGDIVKSNETSAKGAAIRSQAKLWPNGIIPYSVSSSLFYPESLRRAMDDIEAATCIRFRERDVTDMYRLFIKSDSGCWSYIGRIRTFQELSLGLGCGSVGTAQHELMHAIGIEHEQSRPDRDNHVTVLLSNVEFGNENQFEKLSYSDFQSFTAYDYGSVMHYSRDAFSYNGRDTIIPKPNPNVAIGMATTMSDRDKEDINRLYNCDTASRLHGGWGSWTSYSICNPHCSNTSIGIKTRTRFCNNPKPRSGGNDCIGQSSQTISCSPRPCYQGEELGTCNFEDDMCAWKSSPGIGKNTMKFEREYGSTLSSDTGPSTDSSGARYRYYVYLEVTGFDENDYGLMNGPVLPVLPGNDSKRCLSFWYHMYGDEMGYLMVYLQDVTHGYNELLWYAGGNKYDRWHFKEITIDATKEKKIRFYGNRGSSFTGDMALDTIKVRNFSC